MTTVFGLLLLVIALPMALLLPNENRAPSGRVSRAPSWWR